ncbi:hypothetical protein AJ79_02375 [Helicocarpus griseus UAMH5409]|uniref:Protein kinase domain-containing protein n=1 Tax=Helicocarpus griseus UAMH5409 TaxID=1447875 RepID=A0A2B7Y3I3_9EURO|nr:hypothetical protein AJ79_02375 [Helicocarpus griseus UAMH5409]
MKGTPSLTHALSIQLIPNAIVDAPKLPQLLVKWAQKYLDDLRHQPSAGLLQYANYVSNAFDRSEAGNEGSVMCLYSVAIETWSAKFVEDAYLLSFRAIRLVGCISDSALYSNNWQWIRNGEVRMVVEHKGRMAFETFGQEIRKLATANNGSGSPLSLDISGRADGAQAILIKGIQMCYKAGLDSGLDRKFLFKRVDTTEFNITEGNKTAEPGADDSTAQLILYGPIGGGFAGEVFDARLERQGQSVNVAAKFYDPDTEELDNAAAFDEDNEEMSEECKEGESEQDAEEGSDELSENEAAMSTDSAEEPEPLPNEDKEYTFRREIDVYKRLSDPTICPEFYGAFQRIYFTGLQTGMLLMEKIPQLFKDFEDMPEKEREAAYNLVLGLHHRGIHHGDPRPNNFGFRESPSNVSSKRKPGGQIKVADLLLYLIFHTLMSLKTVIRSSLGSQTCQGGHLWQWSTNVGDNNVLHVKEDGSLVDKAQEFDHFITTYRSKFTSLMSRIIVDEGHYPHHPSSGVSRSLKLLKPDFLWIITKAPLLNKTRDFYGYAHLFYDANWSLKLSEEVKQLETIAKFHQAKTNDELFNPLNIRRFFTNGHMDPEVGLKNVQYALHFLTSM